MPRTKLEVQALQAKLQARFPDICDEDSVVVNRHAAPGSRLWQRFAQAVAAAPNGVVDVYLHGTAAANLESVLMHSLLLVRRMLTVRSLSLQA